MRTHSPIRRYGVILLPVAIIPMVLVVLSGMSQGASPLADPPAPVTAEVALDLAVRTLEYVQAARPVPELASRLAKLRKEAASGTGGDDLLSRIKQLRREIIFSHPALDFDTLLINKNPPTRYSHNCDQYLGRHSQVGLGPVLLHDWKSDAPRETVILEGRMPPGAYNKPKLHFDGDRLVFAFCDHTERNTNNRRFFLWQCAIDGSWVRQMTGTKRDPMLRWGGRYTSLIEDNDPCYLPDGGVAFVSTRCQGFGRCHNGRYTPSLLLYRCDDNGDAIRQLSWGEANETDPVVLHDGRIAYTRWDYINRNVTKFHMLWWTRPDGTGVNNFYGNGTECPWMVSETAPIPGSEKVLALATGHHTFSTGCIVRIDPTKGEDDDAPMLRVTPEVNWFEAETVKRSGCYSTPFPLNEELCLASYSRHRIPGQGGHGINDYAIYLVDTLGGRELIYRAPNVSCFSPTPVMPRKTPPVLAPVVDLASVDEFQTIVSGRDEAALPDGPTDDGIGTLSLQNVYLSRNDPARSIEPGTIKSLRVNQIINQPAVLKNGGAQPSMVRHEVPKKILGTVPVCEDGSASFEVPAGVPIQLQALDAQGRAVLTMRSFIYLQPGEQRACVGCHEEPGTPPIPRATTAATRSPSKITPPESSNYPGGFSYARSVQPVLDRYCIECHGLSDDEEKHGGLSLLGTVVPSRLPRGLMKSDPGEVPESYNQFFQRWEMLSIAVFKAETNNSAPRDYFAGASRLSAMLLEGHDDVRLDDASMRRIIDWLDLNSQCYGDFSWNRIQTRKIDPAGEKTLRAYVRELFGEEIAAQPIAALVSVAEPSSSRVLMAPLAEKAGGWGQWKPEINSPNDPRLKRLRELVDASILPLPYHDIAGTCGRGQRCICKSCWVREAEEQLRSTGNSAMKD